MTTRPQLTRDEDHNYFLDGDPEPIPSVTTIIDATVPAPPDQMAWWGWHLHRRGLRPDEELKRTGRIGDAIHKALEDYAVKGEIPDLDDFTPDARYQLVLLAGWLLENRPVFEESEVLTVSLAHRYAGTFDGICRFGRGQYEGKRALIDAKTTSMVKPPKHFPQLEAYGEAERECGNTFDLKAIVWLPREGKGAKARMFVSTYDFEDFEILLRAFRRQQRRAA